MAKEKKQQKDEKKKGPGVREAGVTPRLGEKYKKDIIPSMMKQFNYKNVMQVPRLEKISVNIGVGQATQDAKLLDVAVGELETITGQKAAITKSKKAISNFKLRQGLPIGARVTLRSNKMYDFIDRLINVSLPRIRDFKGINPKSFDQSGNLTIGFKDQVAFVELGHDGLDKPFGVEVTFTITNSNPSASAQFLKLLGFPMKVG